VGPLFVGELEKHAFSLRLLEALAVSFEKLVGSALAANSNQERLLVVDALAELLGSGRKKPVGGALEKEECRPRLELRILGDEISIPILERAEVFLFFAGEPLKDLSATRILRDAGGSRVELQPASLGGNGHAERVSREHELRHLAVNRRCFPAGAAFLARAVNLDDRLRR